MRLSNHMKNEEFPGFREFLSIYLYIQPVNELSDETFQTVKKLGEKLGFKVQKSDSLFDYLKRAGKGVNDLFRTAAIYSMTDLTNKKFRKQLEADAKKTLNKLNKKEVVAFLMQLDRGTIGLTAHIRHILMSFFGIEFATYNRWVDDLQYLQQEVKMIKKKLNQMGLGNSEEMKIIQKFENMVSIDE